ncbi:MAG TPA: phosphate acetyltransferase [Aquiluna sp.]
MAQSIFVASVEGHTIKSAIALGLVDSLKLTHQKIGVFRPVTASWERPDWVLELLLDHVGNTANYEECIGVSYQDLHEDAVGSLAKIVDKFMAFERRFDVVVVLGSDFTDVVTPTELAFNARVAANISSPILLVLNGREGLLGGEHMGQSRSRSAKEIAQVYETAWEEIIQEHATLLGTIVNRADPDGRTKILESLQKRSKSSVWVIPEEPGLVAPRMQQILEAVDGELIYGDRSRLQDEAVDVVVAAMNEEHVLERLKQNAVVVVPSDRTEVILPLLMADSAETFPKLAGLVLNGGFALPSEIKKLIEGLRPRVPVIVSQGGSFDTTMQIVKTRGRLTKADPDKVERARALFQNYVPATQLLDAISQVSVTAITPLLFQYRLFERARQEQKRIVLPEGDDDRVLLAASEVLAAGIANITILGNIETMKAQAAAIGADISKAELIDIASSEHYPVFVAEYLKLRSHKGVTNEIAKERMLDVSYFGTMLVHLGLADGMVSGAAHTTAHTIKPSFEIIKTAPGVKAVSSVFLMALSDRVLVYGDCAVIPEPTTEELADIAISSAKTARAFDIEPQVAMLSYSTGTSGSGVEVEKVRNATKLARELAPELSIEGPIQYDAAVDAAVGEAKLPGSKVAGRATVFVFPDLNTGNNTYKAVQRTAGALAIGPILQGLNKPVNDLSRGALVKDIVNTIAITAIQAGSK